MMALFDKKKASPVSEVTQLRQQGLTDDIVVDELSQRGYTQQQISEAIAQADAGQGPAYGMPAAPDQMSSMQQEMPMPSSQPAYQDDVSNIYERIEEITESMIDERWDDLIGEVKKIVDWKNKVEEKQMKLMHDVEKLQDDFKMLHEAVLGKLDDYDSRMQAVGTDLKAVGKVFKDVIPTFVDNVKELSSIKEELKKKK
ncbi:MAG TPA: hypothetical protein VJA18_00645 [Candidatus Nanoarchaeia archaeon]|nr:hypothetical protein [Candidatus Nanoarchaeia archaeon]